MINFSKCHITEEQFRCFDNSCKHRPRFYVVAYFLINKVNHLILKTNKF